jgi:sugar porter (SP) family MFS transporter
LGIGALLASFVVYGCTRNYQGTTFEWRFPLALQLSPAVPLAILIFLFPESPRWLVAHGRDDDARRSLARLHASGDETDVFVLSQLAEIKAAVEGERRHAAKWSRFVTDKQAFRKVMIGIILQFSVQMTGVSALQYYAPAIFKGFGFGTEQTLLLQSINSIIAIIGEISCIVFVDRLGRRLPLIWCNMAVGSTFIVVLILQALYPPTDASVFNVGAGRTFVAMTWIFNFFFSAGIGPLSFAIPVEILSTDLRAKGSALAAMSCWISNFMIGQITPKALATSQWRFYLLFAICGFTNALTFWAILPETKGRSLEEMDMYFEQTPWLVLGKTGKIKQKDAEDRLRQGIVAGGAAGGAQGQWGDEESAGDHAGEIKKSGTGDVAVSTLDA